MRALLLGLILVNVLYWTWSSNVDTEPVRIARALDPDLPLLELVPRVSPPDIDNPEIDIPEMDPDDSEPRQVLRVGSDDVISVDEQDDAEAAAADIETAAEVPAVSGESAVTSDTAEESVDADSAQSGASVPASATPLVGQNLLAKVDPVANPARCVGVGPFASLRQASEAAALLNEAGLTSSQRVEESQVWVGHWVHLPSYPTREAAILVVERLRKEGVKDIYIEPSGELKNTISLGLFTELERAEIRAGKVRKLGGVSPQIRNRSRDGLVYWVDVALEAGVELDTTGLPHNAAGELRVEPVNCPPVSANG